MRKILAAAAIAVTTLGWAGAANAYSGEYFVTCNLNPQGDNFLALRTCGSSKCRMTHKLGPGTFMLSLEPYAVKGWREVIVLRSLQDQSYSGPRGWVYSKYICEMRY
ncbi:hypothetical protein [Roseibium sp.]|uniref:hypothetical protein n=1 Tax=Roseibium sp. TaxID=1936156 RepID=UPI003A971AC7